MESISIAELAYLRIPLRDVVKATKNFADKRIIGKGGFGNVYSGKLLRDGKLIKIAARRLARRHGQGDVEFWTEIFVLSSLEHKNLVSLIGFCDEKEEKIIVTNNEGIKGSLSMYLSDPALTWKKRLSISSAIASAITYLHYGDTERTYYVIHRNINSSTILLDDEWNPKLSGFEFSIKRSNNLRNQVVLCEAIGTQGYIDPEIEKIGGAIYKSDIYSLGVVLFEILCGWKANEEGRLLAPLAKFHYENSTLHELIHPNMLKEWDDNPFNQWDTVTQDSVSLSMWLSFRCISETAHSCLQVEHMQRPDTKSIARQVCCAHLDSKGFQRLSIPRRIYSLLG